MKKLLFGLVFGLILGASTLVSPTPTYAAGDCDNNAVIRCGVDTPSKLRDAYNANVSGTKRVYDYFGISSASQLTGLQEGRVTKSGDVYVGSKLVATKAETAGRQKTSSDSVAILGGDFYKRPAGSGFAAGVQSLPAYVSLNSAGRFEFAVIKSCGNPVRATPTPPPAPKPRPEYTVIKQVRSGANDTWKQSVKVRPGETASFKITIRNTGNVAIDSVRVQDVLPAGLTATGSIAVSGTSTSVTAAGLRSAVSIPVIEAGKTVTITMQARAAATAVSCNTGLINRVTVKPKGLPERNGNATVYVCKPPVVTPPVEPPTETPVEPEEPVVPDEPEEEAPGELPDTGPGAVAGAFALSSVAGAATYSLQRFYRRRL